MIGITWLSRRRRLAAAYKTLFFGGAEKMPLEEARDIVLADLARFCRARNSTYVKGDPHQSAFLEGRREIWLRIQAFANVTDETLRKIEAQLEGE